MEYEGGSSVISYQFFPGEPPSGGSGIVLTDGLKGPVSIPDDYYSHPEVYGFPEEATPWGGSEERRASLALYELRPLPAALDLFDDQASDARLFVRAPKSWREPVIFDRTDPASAGQTVAVDQAVETDSAQAIAWAPKRRMVAQAVESDIAQTIAAAKRKTLGQALENSSARPITKVKNKALGQAVETDSAQAVTARKVLAILQAIETDIAQAIAIGAVSVTYILQLVNIVASASALIEIAARQSRIDDVAGAAPGIAELKRLQ